MKKNVALIALAAVALAMVASIYIVPTLAHPYWADESDEGEEFIPPCIADENFEPGTYGPGPYYNGTCPWSSDSGDGESGEYYPPWYDPENEMPGRNHRGNVSGESWRRSFGFRRGGPGYRRGGNCLGNRGT